MNHKTCHESVDGPGPKTAAIVSMSEGDVPSEIKRAHGTAGQPWAEDSPANNPNLLFPAYPVNEACQLTRP